MYRGALIRRYLTTVQPFLSEIKSIQFNDYVRSSELEVVNINIYVVWEQRRTVYMRNSKYMTSDSIYMAAC